MTWQLITCSLAFALFIIYNTVALAIFKPINVWSMSLTYYLYNNKKKGLGYIFTAFMWLMAGLLMPGWLEVSDAMGPWMSNFTFLAFFTAAAICFVGSAPAYRNIGLEDKVHMISAKICAGTALAWCFIVCWHIWYVPLIGCAIAALIGLCFKGCWKECTAYWLEMMAFDATFATIITELILKNLGL